MTTPWTQVLRKIDDWRWELPVSYKPGMRVPGLIYADERMLRAMAEEQAIEQVANVATLPGIVGRSLAMPDIHWGYGFPVGGVAAFDLEEGIISPGGVGYDINCLPGDARVLHEFGYQQAIAAFRDRWPDERIKCVNPHTEVRDTEILAFITSPTPTARMFRLLTESGREIRATADHPFLTPDGMIPLGDLAQGQHVSVYPFEGVPYEAPPSDVLVTEEDVRLSYPGHANGLTQVLGVLRRKGLLPLKMDHPALPYLIKLMGFTQGDGSLQLRSGGGSLLACYAKVEDLETIRQDVASAGFTPSRIYQRHRSHAIEAGYGRVEFEHTESCIHVGSTALAMLLRCLGTTAGAKASQDFDVPAWLNRAPRWMKRLYLAALFGAELTSPRTVTGHPYNFTGPVLSLNKRAGVVASGRRYLEGIRTLMLDFGVESALLAERKEHVSQMGEASVRLRLQISSQPANLVRFWSTIGFEYNRRKQYLACVAAQYLRFKMAYPDFPTFIELATRGLGETGQVWDRIVRNEQVPFDGPVYDFTVKDANHNFIADSFVVSNCGVRLLRTDLTEDEVRPHLTTLVDALYNAVPSGVGVGGRVKVGMGEIDEVLAKGARWAVARGYGTAGDLEVTEAGGALEQADPASVSGEAKQRGRGQVGTLGSGNHFLEIQVVDHVFDAAAAAVLGIGEPGRIAVFVHTGSRGLGHQVCTDYLRVCERASSRHGIHLVDRQLACVPLRSPEGDRYFGAMSGAANFAWANRQVITHWVREAFERVLGQSWERLGLRLVYDVAHNIGKIETHEVDGRHRRVCVHRKGATRAFPAGHPEVPARYREVGQPVFIPGDMGRYSFVATGAEGAMHEAFGSTCHGAGRLLGRKAALRHLAGRDVSDELRKAGIVVRSRDRSLLAEEAPEAYKDVADVVAICHAAGLSHRVARMRPIGVVKG